MPSIETFSYLPPSLRLPDSEKSLEHVMQSIDTALNALVSDVLHTSWDVENADREELEIMAESLGLYPQNYMTDDLLRIYIRSAGKIRSLKGTDALIPHLVDTLTKFKIDGIELDSLLTGKINVRVLRGDPKEFDTQQRMLDFLVNKYSPRTVTYILVYVIVYNVIWANSLTSSSTAMIRSYTELADFATLLPRIESALRISTIGDIQQLGAVGQQTESQIRSSKSSDIDLKTVLNYSTSMARYYTELINMSQIYGFMPFTDPDQVLPAISEVLYPSSSVKQRDNIVHFGGIAYAGATPPKMYLSDNTYNPTNDNVVEMDSGTSAKVRATSTAVNETDIPVIQFYMPFELGVQVI